jgi:hypothetical protein
MNELIYVIKILWALKINAKVTGKRNFSDFFADKIVQAGTEGTLLKFIEKLTKLIDADMGKIYGDSGIDFLIVQKKSGAKYLSWIRQFPKLVSMIVCLPKWSDIEMAVNEIEVEDIQEQTGHALPQGTFEIPIAFTTLSPLSHGSDQKAGNATLFRRMDIMSSTGCKMTLPFYAGNATRGEIRDLLSDHLLLTLGLSKQKIAKWFFCVIYSGGTLSEDAESTKALSEILGRNGALKGEGFRKFRDLLPGLSVLGSAMGNRIIPGRLNFSDYRPECREWGSGEKSVGELFDWLYLTRREDDEDHNADENSSMIANTEVIKPGIKFHGGIDMSGHISDLEKSALGMGLKLLRDSGYIGADNRRGFGKINLEIENLPDYNLYQTFLIDNKDKIIGFLNVINALQD